ncbi:sugar ABC transporter substrate-binding protein [Mammaliicoccus sciuri]|uniref:Monosaccharide ABC transporter substrate-binding protein, CUT2 family n=1 Tax=Sporosarcina newyorkensis TaxID=759851 RepID=A0A1T4Y8B4_9BACL|nr:MULTISPECIES: sugar ABC transporter substrate-binding protein [Sporosarcina]MBY0223886.1 sugar ABC transporter substrate-binding protein [Sporosarcina aquimarina]SKA97923.1 monosaccharide ABC transporter substrate-binding protein, CUT2 family [Sporosarcina newyorkensis]
MKKFFLFTVIALMLALVGCGNSEPTSEPKEKIEGVPEEIQNDVKIAVIRNLPSDDHTKQFLDGARSEGESFGFKVDTFISDGDDAKFQDLVKQAIQKKYDGLIISHGKEAYSKDLIQMALDADIKVVTFDTVADNDGITSTVQDDHELARLSLDEIAKLSEDGKPVRVIKLWLGGIPPLDSREEVYQQYEKDGKLETLETIGPANMQNVQGDVSASVSSILGKYKEGSVDAIWGSWDELAKGGFNALKDNKRSDIDLISIDISNQDINLMLEDGSTWLSTAAVDPQLIGIMNMRLLSKKIAGEETPSDYKLEPRLIKQEDLTDSTNMTNLGDVIEGWGTSDDFNEEWMKKLRDR